MGNYEEAQEGDSLDEICCSGEALLRLKVIKKCLMDIKA